MKTERYIIEIEMPEGDYTSAGWLQDIIQADSDVEDKGRQKVVVKPFNMPSEEDIADKIYNTSGEVRR